MPRKKTKRNRKQKHLRETRRKVFSKRIGRGIFDSKFAILLDDNAKAKAEYEQRLDTAYDLNKRLLNEQQEAIIYFEQQGVDGPHTRTRSKTKMAKLTKKNNPVLYQLEHPVPNQLEQLYKDRTYTEQAIKWNQYLLKNLKDGKPENYRELLRPRANWNMERIAPLQRLNLYPPRVRM